MVSAVILGSNLFWLYVLIDEKHFLGFSLCPSIGGGHVATCRQGSC